MLVKNKQAIEAIIKQVIKKPELMDMAISEIEAICKSEKRTNQQNRALHVLFKQISDECMEKNVEMRDIVKDEIPIPCTPDNVKWLWKRIQEKMYYKKSTTELKKSGEIENIYDALNAILIERTKGLVSLPPFPSKEEEKEIEYPTENNDPDKIPW